MKSPSHPTSEQAESGKPDGPRATNGMVGAVTPQCPAVCEVKIQDLLLRASFRWGYSCNIQDGAGMPFPRKYETCISKTRSLFAAFTPHREPLMESGNDARFSASTLSSRRHRDFGCCSAGSGSHANVDPGFVFSARPVAFG